MASGGEAISAKGKRKGWYWRHAGDIKPSPSLKRLKMHANFKLYPSLYSLVKQYGAGNPLVEISY
jgi:hypothetical protein